MSDKPKVLILGGTGFIGRNLVRYLVQNNCCSLIRASDKNRPEMSWLSPAELEMYKAPPVEYIMSNLVNPQSVEKAFTIDGGGQFDYVIDLASVGPYGQDQEFYDAKLIKLVETCAGEAKKRGIKRWIEVSTGQVYEKSKKPSSEGDKLKPWTSLAKSKLAVEEKLRSIGLPFIIVRPAIVYGNGDITGIMPRLVCGAVYKKTGDEMKFLWSGDLQINTVHVNDVCKALWLLCEKGVIGEVYNLADSNKTDQAKICKIISSIYGIKTGFVGNTFSQLAKMNFKKVVNDVNESHMEPWGEIITEHKIDRSPISPFLEGELLLKTPLAIDGSKITSLGFKYDYPAPTEQLLRESLQYWIDQKVMPPV